jgi:hypothetical protein
MSQARRVLLVALAAFSLLVGCDETLEDLVEDLFPDFEGLASSISGRETIVGARPAPGFQNLHCCWVGTRTGWQEVAEKWSTEERTEVDAGVLALLQAFSINIKAGSISMVEAEAKPFYKDRLKDLRHLTQEHCARHSRGACRKEEICIEAVKVGEVSVTTYTEAAGDADAGGLVKIKGKNYKEEKQSAKDVIVGYKMAKTSCGPNDGDVWFEPSDSEKTESSPPVSGETYADHLGRWRKALEAESTTPAPQSMRLVAPSSSPSVLPVLEAEVSGMLGPPPGHVLRGQVIRVAAVDSSYTPHAPLTGLVVSETDATGETVRRPVKTDPRGSAWVAVGEVTQVLVVSTADGREIYRVEPEPSLALPERPPVVEAVTNFQGEGPSGLVDASALVEIRGSGWTDLSTVRIGDREEPPLAMGSGWAVVAPIGAPGPTDLQVTSLRSFTGEPSEVTSVALRVQEAPPENMHQGQVGDVLLMLEGTEEPVALRFDIVAGGIRFADGSRSAVFRSSGGSPNRLRVSVRADSPGSWRVTYRLTSQ